MIKTKSKGFTLIELLVVIAIIAILAAILFPVFARARENARRASCQSNVKQIALGIFMYNQDYDEKLPQRSVAGSSLSASNPYGWADAMQPYLKSEQIFQCPSESTSPPSSTTYATKVQGGQYTDYMINTNAAGRADAQFDAPALTVLLVDGSGTTETDVAENSESGYRGSARYGHSAKGGEDCPDSWTAGSDVKARSIGAQRHLDGANVAFADGHVKWQKGTSGGASGLGTSAGISACAGTDRGLPTFQIGSSDG